MNEVNMTIPYADAYSQIMKDCRDVIEVLGQLVVS